MRGYSPGKSMVGVAGFEPTTSSSRTKRATKLRYTPLRSNGRAQPRQHSRAMSAARNRFAGRE
jgi:hypothetical protein